MLDDLRDHDATPTREEGEWMDGDALELVLRAVALASVALGLGAAAGLVLEGSGERQGGAAVAAR